MSSSQPTSTGGSGRQNQGQNRPNLRIAHRRSPSELTPLMMEQYALQQQIELLQAQQQVLQQQQSGMQSYAQAGLMPPPQTYPPTQAIPNAWGQNDQGQGSLGRAGSGGHRRGQSVNQMPPPAPSAGASGYESRRQGEGHNRRHSLVLPEAKRAAEQAQQQRQTQSFQFPRPTSNAPDPAEGRQPSPSPSDSSNRRTGHFRSQSTINPPTSSGSGRSSAAFQFPPGSNQSGGGSFHERRKSTSHGRSGSRSALDSNWRQQAASQTAQPSFGSDRGFQPGHRSRGSFNSSMGGGSMSISQYMSGGNPQLQGLPAGMMPLNIQAGMNQLGGPPPLLSPQLLQHQQLQHLNQSQSNQAQQQRKSLFAPYLPQATLPPLLADGRLVSGVLRVNKKNRSDAYVTTDLLDHEIFICGSKDRNRALGGDLVAVELLDVDEVWGSKREKEEKKKRKDSSVGPQEPKTGLRRQGSIRDRPEAKKKDDVEVEGQSLMLADEEEVNDEQKPVYAGHIVAVIERTPGQMFSGTLGLLRPSSAATKEKQEAERKEKDGQGSHLDVRQPAERPKIVWFKPTDKRVPLIAIPTEQAPRDFVERHNEYSNRLFVACIKRWPITSLHPFGTLMEELGDVGDINIESEAILRDNSFGSDDFADAVLRSIPVFEHEEFITEQDRAGRRSFKDELVFSISSTDSPLCENAFHVRTLEEDSIEIGVHVADITHYIKAGSVADREARKRGSGVRLIQRMVSLFPKQVVDNLTTLTVGEDKLAFSCVLTCNVTNGDVTNTWFGKSVINVSAAMTLDGVKSVMEDSRSAEPSSVRLRDADRDQLVSSLGLLHEISVRMKEQRLAGPASAEHLHLIYLTDDEDEAPASVGNVYNPRPYRHVLHEFHTAANLAVAQRLSQDLPDQALLRRQVLPFQHRLEALQAKARRLGFNFDISNGGTLMSSLLAIENESIRKAFECIVAKLVPRAAYFVASKHDTPQWAHYTVNTPLYAHFTSPSRRYADVVVHRQLDSVLQNVPYTEDAESLTKLADHCNYKKDAARNAQEQSIHLHLCAMISMYTKDNGPMIRSAIVHTCFDSSFDILVPEYGIEKRVHLDQLPLHKAEYDSKNHILELYWMKGVDPATYVPSESSSAGQSGLRSSFTQEDQSLRKKMLELSSSSLIEGSAIGEDDAGQSRSEPGSPQMKPSNINSKSEPASPVKHSGGDVNLSFSLERLRQEDGHFIQVIHEMDCLPIFLQAETESHSPALCVGKPVNPYLALE